MTNRSSPPSEHSIDSEPVDLGSTPQSLARAVHARRAEYVRPHKVRVKIGTWNIAACPGTDKDLASWLVAGGGLDKSFARMDLSRNTAVEHRRLKSTDGDADSVHLVGGNEIGLYVLGLQEVVDLSLTRDYVNRTVYTDNSPMDRWQGAIEAALPPGYQRIAAEQMTGLLLLIYASPEIAPTITNVSTKQVGTGVLGYFGNKGAVTTRIVLGETTRMVFVNCHLASGAGASYLDRRCWDVGQILSKTQFDPVVHSGVAEDDGEKIGDEDFAFWLGDLNFRLDGLPGEDIRRLLTLHTRGEYDLTSDKPSAPLDGEGVIVMKKNTDSDDEDDTTIPPSVHSAEQSFDSETSLPDPDDFPEDPSQDPTSLQATLDSLLPHDQLRRVIAQRKAFEDGWREGPITFLPSYKYDVGTVGLFDSSEKRRSPSWCDRILYRTRRDKMIHDKRIADEKAAKQKDEEMKSRGLEEDDDVLFSYNPDTDADDQAGGKPGLDYDEYDEAADSQDQAGEVVTKEGFVDRISQDIYTSHQRITSSDHKPIISVFTLEYDAVVPELKAKLHAEVARELDRAENEGRPGVTLVVEGNKDNDNAVDFGQVAFLERKTAVVMIANTSGVPATFSFVETPTTEESDCACLSWLKTFFIRPDEAMYDRLGRTVTLEPGETVLAHIEAQVSTIFHLRSLNDRQDKIEDVLVLRVEDGRDHFIPVRGMWLPTCFGRSIDELIRVPDGGIRKFVSDMGIKGTIPYDSDVHCSAPKELFKLTEAIQTLAERCVADEAMLEDLKLPQDPGWPLDASTWSAGLMEQDAIKAGIVAALDTDTSIFEAMPVELSSAHKLELLSAVLLLFLASLVDGLVPPHLWAKLSTCLPSLTSLPEAAWPDVKNQVLDVLSTAPNHNIAFVFLTSTVSRIASELSPATSADPSRSLSRRLSFRKSDDDGTRRRRVREKRYAEIMGPLAFRGNEKDRGMKEKERIVIEMFLRREADG
ncbi:Phosphoinositide 5-phosphatase [Purpureocillium takamizusanense]|uniref:Phosphoinositide 5-phosphatase n=1 Tax=Purpureocillium takamizusanense TaxID=2060973 RepID=A0A9Q8QEK1_9HYPO|nr:Phosphoinositide 5-phosphatase [Purpureocillium takamizusanense]UNI17771.1 Phosphoinositide 5-phosphatase [Purpureocillium takamizusanense]